MPVYEYRCDACNHQFELRQKFSDAPPDSCPNCGGVVRKMVSTAAFSLKGGGWYAEGYDTKAEPAPKSEADATVKAESTTESAPKEVATADSGPKEAAASSVATPASVASQPAAKSPAVVKTVTPSAEKTKSV